MFINQEEAETDLLHCAAFVGERIANTDAHAAAVSDAARLFAVKGELDLAAGLADSIRDPHARDAAVAEVARQCVDFNDDEYGLQLIAALEDYGVQQQARHNIAIAQSRQNRLDDALTTVGTMDDAQTTLAEIAVMSARSDDETTARRLLEQVDDAVLRTQVFTQIARERIKRGALPDRVLDESLAEIEHIEFIEERAPLLLDVARCYAEAKVEQRALEILEKTAQLAERLEGRFRDQTLLQTAALFARLGKFERAEQIARGIVDLQQTATAHVFFADEHLLRESREAVWQDLEEGLAILKSQPERQIRDSQARFALLAAIAIRFAQAEKFDRALEIAHENPDDNQRDAALTGIAAACARQAQNDLATQAVNDIGEPAQRVAAIVNLAKIEKPNPEKSAELLRAATSSSDDIEQFSLRASALSDIAVAYYEQGEHEQAAELLAAGLQTAAQIQSQGFQSNALARLSEIYEKLGSALNQSDAETLRQIARKRS